MIGEGMKVRFVPVAQICDGDKHKGSTTGIVVYINWKHKYFTVEYGIEGQKQHESFKFDQVGKDVRIIG